MVQGGAGFPGSEATHVVGQETSAGRPEESRCRPASSAESTIGDADDGS